MTVSNMAFLAGGVAVVAVVIGFANVKPWLYVAGGLVVVGFVTQSSEA